MNCPKCNGEFKSHYIEDVQVDECLQCGGMWFDKGELRGAKDETDSDLKWMDFDLWKDQELFNVSDSALRCPHCEKPMAAINYGTTSVVVDTCAYCRGIWLDQGEFQRIIATLQDEVTSKPSSEYAKAALSEATEIVVGGESPISEWRDFRTVLRLLQYRLLVENPKLQQSLLDFSRSSPFK